MTIADVGGIIVFIWMCSMTLLYHAKICIFYNKHLIFGCPFMYIILQILMLHMLGIVFLMLTKPDNILFLFSPFLLTP